VTEYPMHVHLKNSARSVVHGLGVLEQSPVWMHCSNSLFYSSRATFLT